MPKIVLKIIPVLLFFGIFTFVILQIPYPKSLTQANLTQVTSFFIPLYLALVFTFNIFLKGIFLSLATALGLIFMLILQGLDSLNFITGILVLISLGLLLSSFKKAKRRNLNPIKSDLTKLPKIPKLTNLQKVKK